MTKASATPAAGTPVAELGFSAASDELDGIIEEFESGVVDVDRLVDRLQRATEIVDELDRRLRRTRMQVDELVPRLEAIGRDDDGGVVDGEDVDDYVADGGGASAGDGEGETPGLF